MFLTLLSNLVNKKGRKQNNRTLCSIKTNNCQFPSNHTSSIRSPTPRCNKTAKIFNFKKIFSFKKIFDSNSHFSGQSWPWMHGTSSRWTWWSKCWSSRPHPRSVPFLMSTRMKLIILHVQIDFCSSYPSKNLWLESCHEYYVSSLDLLLAITTWQL